MSGTNVRSEGKKTKNLYVACGETKADEKGRIEIPPTTAMEGPSRLDVVQGDSMELQAVDSILHKDGVLTLKDGTPVAKYDARVFGNAEKKQEEKLRLEKERANKENKGTGRGE